MDNLTKSLVHEYPPLRVAIEPLAPVAAPAFVVLALDERGAWQLVSQTQELAEARLTAHFYASTGQRAVVLDYVDDCAPVTGVKWARS